MKLTKQQQKIVDLLCKEGYGNKEIANHFGITEATVKLHILHIKQEVKKETGANHLNRTQIVLYFLKNGIDKEK